jgi:hypothetical protein
VSLCLFKIRETQEFPTSFYATTEAKFCIMALVVGRPLLVKFLMYLTSSSSCCVLRFFHSCAASTRVLRLSWCLLLRVDSSTPNLYAIATYPISSPSPLLSKASIASSIAVVVAELLGSKMGEEC